MQDSRYPENSYDTVNVPMRDLGQAQLVNARIDKPQITQRYNDLQRELENLEMIVRDLGGRLEKVLAPPSPEKASNNSVPLPPMSILAMSICDDTRKVSNLQTMVQDMICRLEV